MASKGRPSRSRDRPYASPENSPRGQPGCVWHIVNARVKGTCPNANAAVKSAQRPGHGGCPLGNRIGLLGRTSMAFSVMSAFAPSTTQTRRLESISKVELRDGLDCGRQLSSRLFVEHGLPSTLRTLGTSRNESKVALQKREATPRVAAVVDKEVTDSRRQPWQVPNPDGRGQARWQA